MIEILTAAAAEERLTFAEFQQRLDTVHSATTHATLDSVVLDLPRPVAVDPRISGSPGVRVSVGTLSYTRRTGSWVVPPVHTTFAVWGGTQIDLTQARFAAQHTVIRAFAYLGAVEIVVPDDITVLFDGAGFLGSFYGDSPPEGPPGCPVVRVTGFAVWGTVRLTVMRTGSREQLEQSPED